jgi:2-polyprenyl-3-methyl-5-hydroxy-6-metoxy-1,4-benzoquinol methylase
MGFEVQGADANQATVSRDQQHAEDQPWTAVYETDDLAEANAIKDAGGFFRDRDHFVTVMAVVDGENPRSVDQPSGGAFFRPSSFPQKGN